MSEILLIRHGKTRGNEEGRYIGITDELLSEEGIRTLEKRETGEVEQVYVSPMKRCIQTAALLFPGVPRKVVPAFRECDFGEFENKNYRELKGNPRYQEWVDSAGMLPFPGGEEPKEFRRRCCEGFEEAAEDLLARGFLRCAMVVHGGTIMSILEAFGDPKKGFYDWQVSNGEGFLLELNEELWKKEKRVEVKENL